MMFPNRQFRSLSPGFLVDLEFQVSQTSYAVPGQVRVGRVGRDMRQHACGGDYLRRFLRQTKFTAVDFHDK